MRQETLGSYRHLDWTPGNRWMLAEKPYRSSTARNEILEILANAVICDALSSFASIIRQQPTGTFALESRTSVSDRQLAQFAEFDSPAIAAHPKNSRAIPCLQK